MTVPSLTQGGARVPPAMRVDFYSHNVTFSEYDNRAKGALMEYCRSHLAFYGLQRTARGKFEQVMTAIFAATTFNKTELRFHINCWPDLVNHLGRFGFSTDRMEMVHHAPSEGVPVTFEDASLPPPYDYQVPQIAYMVAPGRTKVATLQTGKGKAQPLDAAIRTPGGWDVMGNMRAGSKVVAVDGTTATVTSVHPQGMMEVFKVTFADGRSTECTADHLWRVYYINTVKHRRWRVVDTMEAKRLLAMPNPRVYIELITSETGTDAALPMDPYTLGVLLGDAHLGVNGISLSTPDQFIVEEVQNVLPAPLNLIHDGKIGYRISGPIKKKSNEYTQLIKRMGLLGTHSHTKFIPKEYLNASRSQRLAILQGLLDTDGTVGRDTGTISFCSTSEMLAMDVQYLVRSLGGIAFISHTPHPVYTYNGEKRIGKPAFEVNIRYTKPSELFRLPRKKELTNDDNQYSKGLKLRMVSIEPAGYKVAQCIAIDHPEKLYVTDDFIATHNTTVFMQAAKTIGVRTAMLIAGRFVDKWTEDLVKGLGLSKKGDLLVVRGSKDLKNLIGLALEGSLKAKVIIITNKTFNNYLKEYERFPKDIVELYGCHPVDFYQTIGVGLRGIDEVHLDFHMNFRQDLYANVAKTISMSATLEADKRFIEQMFELAFPLSIRPPKVEYDKYIMVLGIQYRCDSLRRLRTTGANNMYSHIAYEESIMRQKDILNKYLTMIGDLVGLYFVDDDWEKGQAMLVFSTTIAMTSLITDYLAKRYPDFRVARYVGGDESTVLFNNDIVCSTLKSAGTAWDIPGLREVLMTDAVNSVTANVQALGRLRRLKGWPDRTPRFIYIFADNIERHVHYSEEKKVKLEKRVLGHKILTSPYHL